MRCGVLVNGNTLRWQVDPEGLEVRGVNREVCDAVCKGGK